jgi:hypothetical protein
MKTARQSGWSLRLSEDSRFVTVYNDNGDYGEFSKMDNGAIRTGTANDVDLCDLPVMVVNLISLWLGVITFSEYEKAYAVFYGVAL